MSTNYNISAITEPETNVCANDDESWKIAIEQYFKPFVAFFSQVDQAIAWEWGYDFLEAVVIQI